MMVAVFFKSLLPLWEIRWREAASCLFLATPIIAIVADSETFHAPTLLSLIIATIYFAATWTKHLRRFLIPEVLVGLLYPTAAPILFAAWFLALRKWKEVRLSRRVDERRRSSVLMDLGLSTPVHTLGVRWIIPVLLAAWTADIVSRNWPMAMPRLAVVVFALFASGLVSMLTSAQSQVK